jgi:hypothetical protein
MTPSTLSAALVLAAVAGALLGAACVLAWRLWRDRRPVPATPGVHPAQDTSTRHEAQRYFLMNETGNVLIATSLSPTGSLPDNTVALFSQALAHLSTLFFAIVGSKDPATGESLSLYDYAVLKRALALHPVFIRVASEQPARHSTRSRAAQPMLYGLQAGHAESPQVTQQTQREWLDERVARTRSALGLGDGAENLGKLRSVHSQMRAEAERMRSRQFRTVRMGATVDLLKPSAEGAAPEWQPGPADDMEVGHITLYCECLMGVSLVSVKLAHAHYHEYLSSASLDMEHDTYLFVAPAQLRSTLDEVNKLPRAGMML